MSYWPTETIEPLVTIHILSMESLGAYLNAMGRGLSSYNSSTYIAANRALFVPFVVPKPITVVQMFCYNGATAANNIDMGIYSGDGKRIVSIGSTAQAGTNALQAFDITDTQIGPGIFYMAIAMDGTTGTLFADGLNAKRYAEGGVAQTATSFPLPATPTLAANTGAFLPLIGLSTRTVL